MVEIKRLVRAGVEIKVTRIDKHFVMDMRGPALDIRGKLKDGEKLFFMAVVTPGYWIRLKKAFALVERMMASTDYIERDDLCASPAPERGLLKLVKGNRRDAN